MTPPLITVIVVPAAIQSNLRRCLNSIINQTFHNFELLVTGRSTDSSIQEILEEFSAFQPQPKLADPELIPTIREASGHFVAIINGEDHITEDMLETLADIATCENCDVVQSANYQRYESSYRKISVNWTRGFYEGLVDEQSLAGAVLSDATAFSALYRRDLLLDAGRSFPGFDHNPFSLRTWKIAQLMKGYRIYQVDYPIYFSETVEEGHSCDESTDPNILLQHYEILVGEASSTSGTGKRSSLTYLAYIKSLSELHENGGLVEQQLLLNETRRVLSTMEKAGIGVSDVISSLNPNEDGVQLLRSICQHARHPLRRKATNQLTHLLSSSKLTLQSLRYRFPSVGNFVARLQPRVLRAPPANTPPIIASRKKRGKNALVVVPWVATENAYFNVVEDLNRVLFNLGYRIHLICYNRQFNSYHHGLYDQFYRVPATTDTAYSSATGPNGRYDPDGHQIDDWCGNELCEFVSALAEQWDFDVCMVHYVFLSRVLDFLPVTTRKLLYTYDIYAGRNSRLTESGLDTHSFSTSTNEEAKGLNRADAALAIQEKEAEYFQRIATNTQIVTLPWLPPQRFTDSKNAVGRTLTIGYFASGYKNNVKAFTDFYHAFKSHKTLHNNYRFLVGGTICERLGTGKLYSHAEFTGPVDNVAIFYARCNLIVNPDCFESGLKLKGIEALSFGLPLVTTKYAMAGIATTSRYHGFSSIDEIMSGLEDILDNKLALAELTQDSRKLYKQLKQQYDSDHTLRRLINI